MSKFKLALFVITLSVIGVVSVSCGNKSHSSTELSEKQGKEYTSAYVCPMHCEGSGSADPGTCPVCGMDYVKNEDHSTDNHSH